ncbi:MULTISPECIES: GNAT family N-acetyltransferase [Derxia]|uniref:GNAT family N-acetyltransferase n=1 Tax=Derxia gummosa DSM 723 TaxID=1121388 RepID=A0A8B6X7R3_9BURK|nr:MULTISPECIES: GNAT family N-acetyltransferase [Derxia]
MTRAPLSAPALLDAHHDCSSFACEHEALNDWLRKRALANLRAGASRSYVVCAGKQVVGYYALAPGALLPQAATGAVRRNMPTPIPVFVLGRLAVDRDWAGMGIGTGLLKDAVLRCVQAAAIVGGRAVLCHAIDERAKAFYLRHSFVQSPVEPMTVMLQLDRAADLLGG